MSFNIADATTLTEADMGEDREYYSEVSEM